MWRVKTRSSWLRLTGWRKRPRSCDYEGVRFQIHICYLMQKQWVEREQWKICQGWTTPLFDCEVMWEIITTKRRITTITDQFRRFIVSAATCGGMKAYCSCGHMTRLSLLRVVLWLVVKSPFDVFHINAVVLFVLCLQVSSTRIPRIPSWLFWTPLPQRSTSLM